MNSQVQTAKFIKVFQQLGYTLSQPEAVQERLVNASTPWQYAFKTLVQNGEKLGITITCAKKTKPLEPCLKQFEFSDGLIQSICTKLAH